MDAQKLRIGVTGLGRVGWSHCKFLAEHADFVLAAAADPEADRLKEAADAYGSKTFADHDAMVKSGLIDVVLIASPTHLHCSQALAAFAAGVHVFLEKPMAVSVDEANKIIAAATAAKKIVTVYQPLRLSATHQQIAEVMRSGKLGKIYHIKRGSFGWVRRNDWQTLQKYGGGICNNYGAHFVDQLFDLTGSDVTRMFCRLGRVASMGDADDVVKLVYQTRDGILGDIDINQATPHSPFEFEIHGAHGFMTKDGNKLKLKYFRPTDLPKRQMEDALASPDRKYPRDTVTWQEETIEIDESRGVDVYADLARAIRMGSEPFVKPRETLAVMKMLERCHVESGPIVETTIGKP